MPATPGIDRADMPASVMVSWTTAFDDTPGVMNQSNDGRPFSPCALTWASDGSC